MPAFSVLTEGFAYGGEAFGRLPDGKICFFRGGVPGETAEVELVSSKRSFARGLLKKISSAAPERIVPKCPHAVCPGGGVFCSGCSFQQVSYPEELRWKQRQLSDFLLRGKLADPAVLQPPVAAPSRFGWRNRLKLSAAEGRIGFFAEDNRTIVDVEHCPLAVPEIDSVLPERRRESAAGEVFFRWTAVRRGFFRSRRVVFSDQCAGRVAVVAGRDRNPRRSRRPAIVGTLLRRRGVFPRRRGSAWRSSHRRRGA